MRKLLSAWGAMWLVGSLAVLCFAYYLHLGVPEVISVIGLIIAAPVTYVAWANFKLGRVDDTAKKLAYELRIRWGKEWEYRHLDASGGLTVSWEAADENLVDEWSYLVEAAQSGPGKRRTKQNEWAQHPSELKGSNLDIRDVLSRVPTGRLVILGEKGAGKTVLLLRLVRDLLERPGDEDPIPVLFPLASWNPHEQKLCTWLITVLISQFPELGRPSPAMGGDVSRAEKLLNDHLLLPVLDGLDEMLPERHGAAIAGINDAWKPDDGLVVTCRKEDYRRAISSLAGPSIKLHYMAGIELQPLDRGTVERYLRHDAGPDQERWSPVFDELGTPTAPIATALSTPLMVSLARTIYNPRLDEHVGSLPRPDCLTKLPNRKAIEGHLLDNFIAAAYREGPEPRPGGDWRVDDAKKWLSFLAWFLEQSNERNMAWWKLRFVAPSLLIGLVVGALSALATGLAAGFGSRVGSGFGCGLGSGIGLAVLIGIPIYLRSDRKDGPLVGLASGLVGGVVGGLAAGLVGIIGIGYAPGAAGGLAAGMGVGVGAGPTSGRRGGFVGSFAGGLLAGLLADVGSGLPAGIINGLGVGLGAGLTVTLATPPPPAQKWHWEPIGLVGGLAAGIAVGLAAWAVTGLDIGLALGGFVWLLATLASGLTSRPVELKKAISPRAVLARDRYAFALVGLSAAIMTGLVAGALVGLAAAHDENVPATGRFLLVNGLGTGIAVGFVCGLVLTFVQTAWGSFAVTRCWLAAQNLLPRKFATFLSDAHKHREVLRQFGAHYQFRHSELQLRLAARRVKPDDGYLYVLSRRWDKIVAWLQHAPNPLPSDSDVTLAATNTSSHPDSSSAAAAPSHQSSESTKANSSANLTDE
jgi:GTPase SAR1 family protein